MLHECWIDPSFSVVVEKEEEEEESAWFIRFSEDDDPIRMEEVPDIPYNWEN